MGTVQIIWQNEERSKFQQHHCRNSKKKSMREKRKDVMEGERENWILVIILPKFMPKFQSCLDEVPEGGVAKRKK